MKIYFAGSIRGGRQDKDLYMEIIRYLQKYGTVLTEHIGLESLTEHGETGITDEWIFTRDMDWLHEADVIVAEVTAPSLGVGYELGRAHSIGKTVLCLHRPAVNRLSAMISGNASLPVIEYEGLEDVFGKIDEFFSGL